MPPMVCSRAFFPFIAVIEPVWPFMDADGILWMQQGKARACLVSSEILKRSAYVCVWERERDTDPARSCCGLSKSVWHAEMEIGRLEWSLKFATLPGHCQQTCRFQNFLWNSEIPWKIHYIYRIISSYVLVSRCHQYSKYCFWFTALSLAKQ